jgi:hypothetical protein
MTVYKMAIKINNNSKKKLKLALTGEKNKIVHFQLLCHYVARKDNTRTYTQRS